MKEKEQSSYTLYEYFLFFYQKKKTFFLLVTVLLGCAVLISFIQPVKYEGRATFYVGDVKLKKLTDADLIKKTYVQQLPANFKGRFDALSPSSNKVTFILIGQDKKLVNYEFKRIISEYSDNLSRQYENKKTLLLDYKDVGLKRIKELNALEKNYRHIKNFATIKLLINSNEQILETHSNLLKYSLEELNLDKPELIDPIVQSIDDIPIQKKKLPLVSNLLGALLLSFIFSVILLVLWKYVTDAKVHLASVSDQEK